MFGRKGAQLCLELQRAEKDQLSRFNNDLFNQVVEEVNEHYRQVEERMRKMIDEGLDPEATKNDDFYGGLIHHHSLLRNKRCLLAYLYHRADLVQKLRWHLGYALPEDVENKLSSSEKDFFNRYTQLLSTYMSSIDLDLAVDLTPPKDPYIQVRVLEEMGDVIIDGQSTRLRRNSIHLLKRSEAESFISQGMLEEFVE